MYYVTKVIETGKRRTTESNVRIGGYKSEKTAKAAAVKHAPAIVRTDGRKVVGQTINKDLPDYIT